MEARGVRDQIVLATKYTTGFRSHVPSEIQANFVGNNAKSMRLSVEASLKKLRTDYIDLVWDPCMHIICILKRMNWISTDE
jgi:aryl-alcohol dehydrogenase-like predicted oxidoreductase